MTTIDMTPYTTSSSRDSVVVNVATFRNAIEHLEQKIHCDYHSCRGTAERAEWAEVTRRVGAELIGMTCKRATVADWDRRERAIERSTTLLSRVRHCAYAHWLASGHA